MKNLLRTNTDGNFCGDTTIVDYGENTGFVYFTMKWGNGHSETVILDIGEMDTVTAQWTALRRKIAEVA